MQSGKRAIGLTRQTLEQLFHIELKNVPRTSTPADIRRAVTNARLQGVSDVAISYQGFKPTERALLTLTHNSYMQPGLKALQNLTIAGLPIETRPVPPPDAAYARQRGAKGREEAAKRGVVTGNGPNGGISNGGKTVTVWGLPKHMKVESFDELLGDFKMADTDNGHRIMKVYTREDEYSLLSRWVLKMRSISEAHRLVRRLHLRHFRPNIYGAEYLMRARVIY